MSEGSAQVQENELKTAFIFNFISFTEWPKSFGASINICALGNDPLSSALDALENKLAKGVAIVVHHPRVGQSLDHCQVVFIGDSERDHFPIILSSLKSKPILTVCDSQGFAQQGVMIELGLEERRIVFKINVAAVKEAHLVISSKLLRLAKVVY